MEQIPVPDLLDPDRVIVPTSGSTDDGARLDQAREALRRSCEYGRKLWDRLDQVRHYLAEQVADGGGEGTPSLLRSDRQWDAWADVYAAVTSDLAGTHGDSGLGQDEARHKAQDHGVTLTPLEG